MSKENIKKMSGVMTCVFAHLGQISKEEAKELCGLDDGAFEEVYARAGEIAARIDKVDGKKMDAFLEHYGKAIEDYVKKTTHYFLLT